MPCGAVSNPPMANGDAKSTNKNVEWLDERVGSLPVRAPPRKPALAACPAVLRGRRPPLFVCIHRCC